MILIDKIDKTNLKKIIVIVVSSVIAAYGITLALYARFG